jgi:hypothetical protein
VTYRLRSVRPGAPSPWRLLLHQRRRRPRPAVHSRTWTDRHPQAAAALGGFAWLQSAQHDPRPARLAPTSTQLCGLAAVLARRMGLALLAVHVATHSPRSRGPAELLAGAGVRGLIHEALCAARAPGAEARLEHGPPATRTAHPAAAAAAPRSGRAAPRDRRVLLREALAAAAGPAARASSPARRMQDDEARDCRTGEWQHMRERQLNAKRYGQFGRQLRRNWKAPQARSGAKKAP